MKQKGIRKSGQHQTREKEKLSPDEVRRSFVKKTVYAVPKFILLGSFLSRPVKVKADHTGGPPPPPDDW